METFSALLALCVGNSPVTGEFPAQRPVTRSFDIFYQRLNKRVSKQSWGWWFDTPSRSLLWRHCSVLNISYKIRHTNPQPKPLECVYDGNVLQNCLPHKSDTLLSKYDYMGNNVFLLGATLCYYYRNKALLHQYVTIQEWHATRRYRGQWQVITSHRHCGMWILTHALDTSFWHNTPQLI